MVRSEIISKLSKKIHQKLKKSEIEKILEVILDTVVYGIAERKNTEIRSFGTFSVKKMKEKTSRNPKTNEKIYVSEKKSIKFRMSKILKSKINQAKDVIN